LENPQGAANLQTIGKLNGGVLSVTMALCWRVKTLINLYEKTHNTFIQMMLFGGAQNAVHQKAFANFTKVDPTTQKAGRVGG
jgi:hypothetical protein